MRIPGTLSGVLARQWPLLALITFMLLVFCWQSAVDFMRWYPYMAVPVRVVDAWEALLARDGSMGEARWRALGTLLSCALMHGSFEHWAFNMLFLWIFAALAVELLGHLRMLLLFVVTAVCGSACHVALNPDSVIPMLGASGAVMGFEGAYLGMAVRWRLPDPHVWPMARPIPPGMLALIGVMGLVFDLMGFMDGVEGVAYGAHLGGFVSGLVMAAVVLPRPRVAAPH